MLHRCALIFLLVFSGAITLAHESFAQAPTGLELDSVAPVFDAPGVLQANDIADLKQLMLSIDQRHGVRVGIVIVASAGPEGIERLANDLANRWRIGARPGILIAIAREDRLARLEVSRDLEAQLPDLVAQYLIRESLAPHLGSGQFRRGLEEILSEIDARLALGASAERTPTALPSGSKVNKLPVLLTVMVWQLFFPGIGAVVCLVGGIAEVGTLKRWWAPVYLVAIGVAEFVLMILLGWSVAEAGLVGITVGVVAAVMVRRHAIRCEPRIAEAAARIAIENASKARTLAVMRQRRGRPVPRAESSEDSNWSSTYGSSGSGWSGSNEAADAKSDRPSDDFAGGGSTGRW